MSTTPPAPSSGPTAGVPAGSGRLRAIVFDFDGVILESTEVKTEAFVELYAEHGPKVVAQVRAHHLANLGISRFKKFEWIAANLLGQALTEDAKAALGQRFTDLALARVLDAPMVAGALAALTALAPRMPLFVASGTPQDELDLIVDRRGLRGYFREVWGTPAEKPAIVRDLLTRHDLQPHQVLFIGDGLSDHKAAVATGLHFLARTTPPLHEDWVKLGARRVEDLTSLVTEVEQW